MKSDWQDAPQRVRTALRGTGWGRWLGLLGLLALAWLVWAYYSKTLLIDWRLLQQAVRLVAPAESGTAFEQDLPQVAGQVVRAPPEPPAPNSVAPSASVLGWQAPPPIRSGQQLRNDFNDSNYQPRAPDNLYTPPNYASNANRRSQPQPRPERQAPELTVELIKSWDGSTTYRAQWYSQANYIDGGTVCGNFRRGSIEYRECRKGAKQHFHEQCRAWRARYLQDRADHSELMRRRYCSAASSFSPMS